LSLRLKERKLSACMTNSTAVGKLFHTTGPATEKLRKLCRQISSSYVEQSSWYRSLSGADRHRTIMIIFITVVHVPWICGTTSCARNPQQTEVVGV